MCIPRPLVRSLELHDGVARSAKHIHNKRHLVFLLRNLPLGRHGRMAALDEHPLGTQASGRPSDSCQVLDGPDLRRRLPRLGEEEPGFGHIGRKDGRTWEESRDELLDCLAAEELGATSSDHDGINDHCLQVVFFDALGDHLDSFHGGEHAFHGATFTSVCFQNPSPQQISSRLGVKGKEKTPRNAAGPMRMSKGMFLLSRRYPGGGGWFGVWGLGFGGKGLTRLDHINANIVDTQLDQLGQKLSRHMMDVVDALSVLSSQGCRSRLGVASMRCNDFLVRFEAPGMTVSIAIIQIWQRPLCGEEKWRVNGFWKGGEREKL